MKKLAKLSFLWLLLCPGFILAQSETIHVINAGSGNTTNGNIELTYFIGDYIGIGDYSREYEMIDMHCYPNPVKTILHINTTIPYLDKIQIYNVQGILIRESTLENNQVDYSQLPDGIYLMKILDKDQQNLGTVKVVKNSNP